MVGYVKASRQKTPHLSAPKWHGCLAEGVACAGRRIFCRQYALVPHTGQAPAKKCWTNAGMPLSFTHHSGGVRALAQGWLVSLVGGSQPASVRPRVRWMCHRPASGLTTKQSSSNNKQRWLKMAGKSVETNGSLDAACGTGGAGFRLPPVSLRFIEATPTRGGD